QDTIVAALMEQLIAEGPDGMAQVFTTLFNLAMRLERERFLGAGLYERNLIQAHLTVLKTHFDFMTPLG
ncbi:MAG: hypothetical protein ACXW3Q_14750, partial [Rhodoplanes sp.]